MIDPSRSARESLWLLWSEAGVGSRSIAQHAGFGLRAVQIGLARARAEIAEAERRGPDSTPRAPRLVPLWPVGLFAPSSPCPHSAPIPPGSNLCCMVCFQSGLDHLPALQRSPATDPKPDRKHAKAAKRLTRRVRREKLRAA